MRDHLTGPGRMPLRPGPDPWAAFALSLTRHLRRPGAVGAMQFSAPPESTGESARCTVQVQRDGSSAWVTYRPSGSQLAEEMVLHRSPGDPEQIARAVIGTCHERMRVPHPHLLTFRCQGEIGRHTETLGLTRTDSVPIGGDPADNTDAVDIAVEVTGPEDVRDRFAAIVERVTGDAPVVDEDGDLAFTHVGHTIYVSFTEDDPSARLWAWVVRGVRSRSETAVEIGKLNRDEEWTSWILDGRHVMQRTTLSVGPFLPRHVQFHLERFLYTFASTTDVVAARLGPGPGHAGRGR